MMRYANFTHDPQTRSSTLSRGEGPGVREASPMIGTYRFTGTIRSVFRRRASLSLLLGSLAACVPAAWSQGTEVLSGDCSAPMLALANDVPSLPLPLRAAPRHEATPGGWQACQIALADFLRERTRLTAIDTRSAGERRRIGIPGALAIDVKDLAAKPFLKNAEIVLVGSGLNDDELYEQCTALRGAPQLRVAVLEGGVRSLHRAAQALAGNGEDIAKLDWVSAEELHRLVLHSAGQVALVDLDDDAALPFAINQARRVNSGHDWARTAATLKKLSERQTHFSLVALAHNEASATALQAALNAAQARRVLVVRDGLPAYRAYLDAQQRIAANANLKLIRPCGSS
jgi:hypothetical protein